MGAREAAGLGPEMRGALEGLDIEDFWWSLVVIGSVAGFGTSDFKTEGVCDSLVSNGADCTV